MSNDLNKILIYVPEEHVELFKSSHITTDVTDEYFDKVNFLGNGQIVTKGKVFGASATELSSILARLDAIEEALRKNDILDTTQQQQIDNLSEPWEVYSE